ncbi:MAG: hypothetical protein WCK31_02190 [bacterium]
MEEQNIVSLNSKESLKESKLIRSIYKLLPKFILDKLSSIKKKKPLDQLEEVNRNFDSIG